MQQPKQSKEIDRKQYFINLSMATVAGQVGCLTLVIIFLALFIGLLIDNYFDTRPVFLIIFLLGSAPISLGLTFWVAMRAAKNIKPSGMPGNLETSEPKQKVNYYDEEGDGDQ